MQDSSRPALRQSQHPPTNNAELQIQRSCHSTVRKDTRWVPGYHVGRRPSPAVLIRRAPVVTVNSPRARLKHNSQDREP
jgi:hypothetical protein